MVWLVVLLILGLLVLVIALLLLLLIVAIVIVEADGAKLAISVGLAFFLVLDLLQQLAVLVI